MSTSVEGIPSHSSRELSLFKIFKPPVVWRNGSSLVPSSYVGTHLSTHESNEKYMKTFRKINVDGTDSVTTESVVCWWCERVGLK